MKLTKLFAGSIIVVALLTISSSVLAFSQVQKQNNLASAHTISSIKEKMLNSIDYYHTLKGSYRKVIKPLNVDETVDFTISQGDKPGSSVKVKLNNKDNNNNTIETLSNDKNFTSLDTVNKVYSKVNIYKFGKFNKSQPRTYKGIDGKQVFVYRPDPANSNSADTVAFPQVYAFWLGSAVKLAGSVQYLGRNALLLEGPLPIELQKKHDAVKYKMWIDSKTGILLKLVESTASGEITNQTEVTSLKFNTSLDSSQFSKSVPQPKNYKKVSLFNSASVTNIK
jgi:hypothetical protein